MITWVFIPLLGISAMFAYERQKGTLRRPLTTPTRRPTYLLGAVSGQVATALVQMLLLVAFGAIVLHLDWGQSPAALAAMLITSALAAAALGTTLGTFVKTEAQAGGLSMMLGMVMALLGGCWYPIELFPPFVQTAARSYRPPGRCKACSISSCAARGWPASCCRRPCWWDLLPCSSR